MLDAIVMSELAMCRVKKLLVTFCCMSCKVLATK